MYQIKVNGVLMPTIYYHLSEAIEACEAEKARGCAVFLLRLLSYKEVVLC